MNTLQAIILGIIQGITEFLPISSSGHLVIAQSLFGINNDNLAITIVLHLGTFFAIIAAYPASVWNLIKEFFGMLFDLIRFKGFNLSKSKYRYYLIYIVIASIPAGIVGVLLNDLIENVFSKVFIVSMTLFLTGFILLLGEKISQNNHKEIQQLGFGKSIIVGLFQMVAILPGISRSGTTMVGGLVCGLKKEEALEFSFLLALPAILGSVLIEMKDIVKMIDEISMIPVVCGFITSLIIGYLSIKLFNLIVKKGHLVYFSVYCWTVGLLLAVNISYFK
ncbi:MAG: undecaprenyl-diphosphate phosphatase [Anaerofustis sp.]